MDEISAVCKFLGDADTFSINLNDCIKSLNERDIMIHLVASAHGLSECLPEPVNPDLLVQCMLLGYTLKTYLDKVHLDSIFEAPAYTKGDI